MSTEPSALPTPQFPGHFPLTPSASSSSTYAQTEGPLEAAGRDLPPTSTPTSYAGAILGAAAGLLAGGVPGAVLGASLGGLGQVERDALRAKGAPTVTAKAQELPGFKEGGPDPAQDVSSVGGLKNSLSDGEKAALGVAGAGLAAGGLVAATSAIEPDERSASNIASIPSSAAEIASPIAGVGAPPTSIAAPLAGQPAYLSRPTGNRSGSHIAGITDKELLAGGFVGSGAVAATLAEEDAYSTTPKKNYPTSTASDQTVTPPHAQPVTLAPSSIEPPTEAETTECLDGLNNREKVLLAAGAGGLAGVGAGAAFEQHQSKSIQTAAFSSSSDQPPSAALLTQHSSANPPPPISTATVPVFESPRAAPVPGSPYEAAHAQKSQAFENAVAGGAIGAEGVRRYEQPNTVTSQSHFQEMLAPVRPQPTSHFSDATFAPSLVSTNSSSSILHAFNAGPGDGYDEQRVVAPVSLGDEPVHSRVLTPADLDTPTSAAGLAGFQAPATEGEMTDAMRDFAHLTPTVPQRGAYESFDDGDDDAKFGLKAALAGTAGLALGGAAVAYGAFEDEPQTSRRYGQPSDTSPEPSRKYASQPDRFATLQTGNTSPSRSSSTRAQHGSPGSNSLAVSRGPSAAAAAPDFSKVEHEQEGAPVVLSPHMHIATRKDSIGHNRLHKTSLDREVSGGSRGRSSVGAASSPPTAAQAYASSSAHPETKVPQSPGEEIWKHSVAQVVNDETDHRGGQRPALVTIDSEDRRDFADSRTPPPPISSQAQHSRARSSSISTPPESPSSPNSGHKLQRKSSRRRASVGSEERKKEGFLHKVFGGRHSRQSSGEVSPRDSGEMGRASPRASGDTARQSEEGRRPRAT